MLGTEYGIRLIESIKKIGSKDQNIGDKVLSIDLYKFKEANINEELLGRIISDYVKGSGASSVFGSWTASTIGSHEKKNLLQKIRIILGFGTQIFAIGADEGNMMDMAEAVFYDFKGKYLLGLDRLAQLYDKEQNLAKAPEHVIKDKDFSLLPYGQRDLNDKWKLNVNEDNDSFMALYDHSLLVIGKYEKEPELIQNLSVIDDIINFTEFDKRKRDSGKWQRVMLESTLITYVGELAYIVAGGKLPQNLVGNLAVLLGPFFGYATAFPFIRAMHKRSITKKMSDNISSYVFGIVKEGK